MGLDIIELFLEVEDAFELVIPDEDAVHLESPGEMIEYLCRRLGETSDGPPLVQVAFYRIRVELAEELEVSRKDIRPDTSVSDLVPNRDVAKVWEAVARRLGSDPRDLSASRLGLILSKLFGKPPTTVGDAAQQLAMLHPAALRPVHMPWTRAQVTEVVYRLLERTIAVDARPHGLDAKFIRDLGMG